MIRKGLIYRDSFAEISPIKVNKIDFATILNSRFCVYKTLVNVGEVTLTKKRFIAYICNAQ